MLSRCGISGFSILGVASTQIVLDSIRNYSGQNHYGLIISKLFKEWGCKNKAHYQC